MHSFRRLALLLALLLPAFYAIQAEVPSSSSNPASPAASTDPSQESTSQAQAQPTATQMQPQVSVQARIKARREQRRATAIREVYNHLYEGYVGAGYLRFRPGPTLQHVNEYNWDAGFTRYYNERLGVTLDGRGYYGTPFIRPIQLSNAGQSSNLTKPTISQYAVLIGPTYRFYMQPKFSVSGRVMGGYAQGNFSGDTNGSGDLGGLLYPDGPTYAASAGIIVEYNLGPSLGLRVAPEYYLTGFGSTAQNNWGYTAGLVYRFGKQ
jgi:hypothetical protein